jgi:serine/threonine-protein kinase RsbW
MTEAELGGVGIELGVALGRIEKVGALVRYCSSCEFDMQIPADPLAIGDVSAGVNELLAARQWPRDEMMSVELAVQEALANAVRHGCKSDPSKQVQCCVTLSAAGELVIVVRDPGPGFDVTAVASPLDAGNLLKPSGRGVFLINQLMDSVEFTHEGRQVLMRKRRREPGAVFRIYRS